MKKTISVLIAGLIAFVAVIATLTALLAMPVSAAKIFYHDFENDGGLELVYLASTRCKRRSAPFDYERTPFLLVHGRRRGQTKRSRTNGSGCHGIIPPVYGVRIPS